jgi:cytochrome c-type biogenesis protein CcmE
MTNWTLAKLVLTTVVAVGGGGFLIYSSVSHAAHDQGVDELVAGKLETWKDKTLKVGGVVEGAIVEQVIGQETFRSFVMERNGKKIRVFSRGPKPDTFKERSMALATGQVVPAAQFRLLAQRLCQPKDGAEPPGCPIRVDAEQAWVVDASELSAKCPSKYGPSLHIDADFKARR